MANENGRDGEPETDNIVIFTPRADLDAKQNFAGFMDVCRNRVKVFGTSLDFDSNVWDITKYLKLKGKVAKKTAVFRNLETSRLAARNDGTPMKEPFLSFAKGYFRYQHGLRPTKSFGNRLTALRALEQELVKVTGTADPTLLNDRIFESAAQMIQSEYKGAAYYIGNALEMIGETIATSRLSEFPIRWKNSISKSKSGNRVGKEADEARTEKLPSKEAMDAIPQIFNMAQGSADVIVASVLAIMFSMPDRINEVVSLVLDCEVDEWRPDKKEHAYGIRWRPSKGAEPMIKWVLPTMTDVVRLAIKKLREHTDAARKVAKWYEDNPELIYLPPELEYLRNEEWISVEDVAQVVHGDVADPKIIGKGWVSANKIKQKDAKVRFAEVESAVLKMLPMEFPFIPGHDDIKYSSALMVMLRNQVHDQKGTYQCMVAPVAIDTICNRLGGKVGQKSIFERYGFLEPDGSLIKMNSHQLRHYLNTVAQAGSLSQLDIALWSGRKDIRQNVDYDHETSTQIVAKIRGQVANADAIYGTLATITKTIPISRDQFAILKYQTAHTTDFGFCTHDYSMSPCQQHVDCLNCGDLMCVKGDTVRNAAIRREKDEAENLLSLAQEAAGKEYDGADRWAEHHRMTYERASQICKILDDPNVPDGALIQFEPEQVPTRIRMVTPEHVVVIGSAAPMKVRAVAYVPNAGEVG